MKTRSKKTKYFEIPDELYEQVFEGGSKLKEMSTGLESALKDYKLVDYKPPDNFDYNNLKKIKTKEDFVFHVSQY